MGLEERLLHSGQTAAARTPPEPADASSSSNGNGLHNNMNNATATANAPHPHPSHPSPAPVSFSSQLPPRPPLPAASTPTSVLTGESSAHPGAAPDEYYTPPQSTDHDAPHGDDLGPPRKRRRPALSCESCRRRKVRCDRMQPCGPCVRMGVHASCEYDNRPPRPGLPGANEFSARTPSYQRPGEDHYDSTPRAYDGFEAQLRTHAAAPTPTSNVPIQPLNGATPTNGASFSSQDPANGLSSYLVNPQREVRDLLTRLTKVEHLVSSPGNGFSSRHDPHLQQNAQALTSRVEQLERRMLATEPGVSDTQHKTGLAVPVVAPRIRVPISGQNTTKFWGPTHYLHLFDPNTGLFGRMLSSNPRFYLPQVVPSPVAVDEFQHCQSLRQAVKDRNRVKSVESLPDIVKTLPDLQLRDELIEQYLRTVEELYGIFHAPSFQDQYGAHRQTLDRAPVVVLVQLLLVFAIGAVFVSEPRRSNLRPLVSRWVYSAQAWLTGPLEKPHGGDEWVRCWCLLILARQCNSVGTKEQTCTLAGAMVRSALSLGLHRDPSNSTDLSPFRIEMRRRLWSVVLEISLSASSDASMPPIISPEEYDCQAPCHVSDSRMDERSGPFSQQYESDQSVRKLFRESYPARREVAAMLDDFNAPMLYDRLLKLTADLDATLSRIGSFFSKQSQARTASASTDFYHKLLVLVVHSSQLDLHAAFLPAAKNDPRFHFSRHKALESAMALLSSLGFLDHRSPALDDISRLTLVGMGVFKSCLSVKAIAVVCQEVNIQLAEAQTPFSVASREPFFRTLRNVQVQSLNLIKSGDPSCKRYTYLSVAIPMMEARQAGRPADEVVPKALSDCLRVCQDVLTSQMSPEQVPPTPTRLSGGASHDVKSVPHGLPLEDMTQFEKMDFSFDPSWLLTAWHTESGMG